MRLENKVGLITGGTSGIGEATALLFAREGAKVAITGRNADRGRAVVEKIAKDGGKAAFIQTDVRMASDCRRAVDETVRAFGGLDILFNNAGVFYPHTILDCTEEEWDLQMDINLKGTFLMSKAALPGMIERRRGVIINNSSGWGIAGGDSAVAYCASKGGVLLLTKAAALEWAPLNIRVNSIHPGFIDTPMVSGAIHRAENGNEMREMIISRHALGRLGEPREIADAVVFLLRTSPAS